MNDMSETACEICCALALYWGSIAGYRHFRCSRCEHLFVFPRPSQDDLDSFYQQGRYYDSAEKQRDRITKDANSRLQLLETFVKQHGLEKRILDVGCASGIFLSVARERGWDAYGVERSEVVADRARSISGAKIAVGILEEMIVSGAPFSVVTAWEVIEHTIDPRMFFAALVKNVVDNGLVSISTPLSNGIPAKVLGKYYPMLMPPEHLSLFTRDSLKILAKEFNFDEVHYSSFSNLNIGSLASGFCRLVAGKNLDDTSFSVSAAFRLLATTVAWAPLVIDTLGYGTEMQTVYRRLAKGVA